MQSIGEFILNNVDNEIQEPIHYNVMQNGIEMYMDFKDIYDSLFKVVDISKITTLTLYPDNIGIQRKTIISFIIQNKNCEIGEHYGTQRDYFWVKISPI
jgi:hypothetical protein